MKKITLALHSLLFWTTLMYSQKSKNDFVLSPPPELMLNSLYSTVDVIDDRYDKSNMGRIWVGLINNMNRTSPAPPVPFALQLKEMISKGISSPKEKGNLLLHLRFFKFSDKPAWIEQQLFCYFRAGLYEQAGNMYKRICMIDTALKFTVPKRAQSPQKIFSECSLIISDLILQKLNQHGDGSMQYSMSDILHTDSIEKRNLPVYNTNNYKDGIYKDYASFKIQEPDYTIASADTGKGTILYITPATKKGKKIKLELKDMYATVYNNQIYMHMGKGFVPIVKLGDDFYLTAKMRTIEKNSTGRNVGNVALDAPDYFLAPLRGLSLLETINRLSINKHEASRCFQMKIDHLDGLPIKLKEVGENGEEKVAVDENEETETAEEKTTTKPEVKTQEEVKKEKEPETLTPF